MIIVVLVLLALAAGVAAGYVRGGRLRRLAADPPVRNRLILTALGIYVLGVLGGWLWSPLLPVLSALCWIVLGFYAWLNRTRAGALLVAVGLAANGLVILVNGGMPISADAAARAGMTGSSLATDGMVAANAAPMPWLGKTVPVAFPPQPEVVSPGDMAIAAGCATAVAVSMTRRRPARDQATLAARATMDGHPSIAKEHVDHGEEGTQAQGSQEEGSQPREAAQ